MMKCTKDGCSNAAEWDLVLTFFEKGEGEPCAHGLTGYALCETHRDAFRLADVLTDDARITLTEQFMQLGKDADLERTGYGFMARV
jgi:hypothetical protein